MINELEENIRGIILKDNIYSVVPFDNSNSHFLGINNENQLALLLKTENSKNEKFINFKGKNLKILFDRLSEINSGGIDKNERFTIIHLISEKKNVQYYFVDICRILIGNIGENPDISLVKKELEYVKNIFLNLNKIRIKEEIGLWGELFLIYLQENKENAVMSWHLNSKDRIDFNSGSIKIEVKTTLSNERKHTFKLNQLRNHYKENVIIGSLMTTEIENGISIKDLVNRISLEISDSTRIKLFDKISSVLGNEILSMSYRFFDETSALESFQAYRAQDIPAIEKESLSMEISNVSFTSDLTNSISIPINKSLLIS